MQKIVEPSKEELEDLLFNQLLSKKKVAQHYNVCIGVIIRWMKKYNISIPVEIQKQKRAKTRLSKKNNPVKKTIRPGFNSEFLEEYAVEEEMRERHLNEV